MPQNIETAAEAQGLEIVSNEAIDKNAPNYRSLAAAAADAGADCFIFSGITANNAVQLYKDFAAALPDAKLYGPDGVAEAGFVDPSEGGIPADVASRVTLTVATLSPDQYPEEGQAFFDAFREKHDEPNPNPYAIYGYEAMRLALDAIERSEHRRQGRHPRGAVRHERPRERARHVLDRRERRHHAQRLRRLQASRTASWSSTARSRPQGG